MPPDALPVHRPLLPPAGRRGSAPRRADGGRRGRDRGRDVPRRHDELGRWLLPDAERDARGGDLPLDAAQLRALAACCCQSPGHI